MYPINNIADWMYPVNNIADLSLNSLQVSQVSLSVEFPMDGDFSALLGFYSF